MRDKGYNSCPVCVCVCVCVCLFSLFCLLALSGVQREISAAIAWKMPFSLKLLSSKVKRTRERGKLCSASTTKTVQVFVFGSKCSPLLQFQMVRIAAFLNSSTLYSAVTYFRPIKPDHLSPALLEGERGSGLID